MNANQFLRHLQKEYGIKSETKKSHGHLVLVNPENDKISEIPMHGANKQLGTKLKHKILKDLGLR